MAYGHAVMGVIMTKLFLILLLFCAASVWAATITNWGAQLPTAAPNSSAALIMQQGGTTYHITPPQLAAFLATNEALRASAPPSSLIFNSNGTLQGSSRLVFTNFTTLHIDSGGAVGTAQLRLENSSQPSSVWEFFIDSNPETPTLGLRRNNAYLVTWEPGGNFGIGTTNPANRLDVEGRAAIGASYSGNLTAPANGLIVEGQVGIGTNSPDAGSMLHIRPTLSGQGYLRVDDTNGTPRLQIGVYPGFPAIAAMYLGNVVPSSANHAFASDGTTTYFAGGSSLEFQTAGSSRWNVNAAGHFIAAVDNSFDIGASGANRPRNIYAAGDISAVGNHELGFSSLLFWSGRSVIDSTADGNIRLRNQAGLSFNVLQFGGSTAAFPALGRTNGHVSVIGAEGAVDGTSTNGIWVMGGPIIQDFKHVAPAAPTRTGAVYWSDGTNVCVVLRNSAGGLTTNKLSMTAWP